MARHAVVDIGHLDPGLILTPERYDPRRRLKAAGSTVADVCTPVSEQISQKKANPSGLYLVLDTGDAREGLVLTRKKPIQGSDLGSNKKLVQAGDLVISRLRPYLRQVAFIDERLTEPAVTVACSTEFFVLRGKDAGSIAFLVPWLLSSSMQEALAAAQEGGHHPRFNLETLMSLPVAASVLERRNEIAQTVEDAVERSRASEAAIRLLVDELSLAPPE